MARRVAVLVSFDLSDGVTRDQAADYVCDAVSSWKGSYDPNEPLFDLNHESVRARLVRPSRTPSQDGPTDLPYDATQERSHG